jgi:hypothetical protein
MTVSIKRIMTSSLETLQKKEWHLPTASHAVEPQRDVPSMPSPPPRKGSWDGIPRDVKEEGDLEFMIQCTTSFF